MQIRLEHLPCQAGVWRETRAMGFFWSTVSESEFATCPEAWRTLRDPFPQWLPNEPHAHAA